jgi:hypothetical protein
MTVFPLAGATFAALAVICVAGAAFLLRRIHAFRMPAGAGQRPRGERDPTRTVRRQSAALLVISVALAVLGLLVFYLLVSVLPLLGLV